MSINSAVFHVNDVKLRVEFAATRKCSVHKPDVRHSHFLHRRNISKNQGVVVIRTIRKELHGRIVRDNWLQCRRVPWLRGIAVNKTRSGTIWHVTVETAHFDYPVTARDKPGVALFDVFNTRPFTRVLFKHLLCVNDRITLYVGQSAYRIDVIHNNLPFTPPVSTPHEVSFVLSEYVPVATHRVVLSRISYQNKSSRHSSPSI